MKSQISELNLLMKETEVSDELVCALLFLYLGNSFTHNIRRAVNELGGQGWDRFRPCFSGLRETRGLSYNV